MKSLLKDFKPEELPDTMAFTGQQLKEIADMADFDWDKLKTDTNLEKHSKTLSFILNEESYHLWEKWVSLCKAENNEQRLVQLLTVGFTHVNES